MPRPEPQVSRPESLTAQVARNIRNEIEAGVLRDGEVLPSSRELATRWQVSVFTINEAMKTLTSEGLVLSKSRSNRVVTAPHVLRAPAPRTLAPQVLLIGGYAGSGKSELGRIIARETGWPIFDKDTLTRPAVEFALEVLGHSPHDRESETYLREIRPREYQSLIAATVENVECGNSAIVTAPFIREFTDPTWVARTQAALTSREAVTHLIWVYCDADTMYTYIRARGAARDAAKMADWPGYLATIDTDFRPTVPHTVIDNSADSVPLQAQARELIAALYSRTAP